jgi:hypothetical protein
VPWYAVNTTPQCACNIASHICWKMSDSYRARKEAFVSNLSGGPLHEINLVTIVAPVRPPLLRRITRIRVADDASLRRLRYSGPLCSLDSPSSLRMARWR